MSPHQALYRAGPGGILWIGRGQDAVIRNLEVIGEAAKRVSAAARAESPQLEWKAICGMRDVLIHDYIGVDLDEVWNVALLRIPELQTVLDQHLGHDGEPSSAT